ncbi:MAG: ATP-dependent DNA helicase RecG [Coriobacteriales bacterium]
MTVASQQQLTLDSPVTLVRGCAAARAQRLAKLGIKTVRDLVSWYPHRYIDLSNMASCAQAPLGEVVSVVGRLEGVRQKQPRPGMHIIEAAVVDDTGAMALVWFKQPWLINSLHPGDRVCATGKVAFSYGMRQMSSPMIEVLGSGDDAPRQGMVPVHRACEGVSPAWMRRLVANALNQLGDLPDPLPAALRAQRGLMGRKAALRAVHFPSSARQLEQARRRLAYEEVLRLQLEMMLRRNRELSGCRPVSHAAGPATAALQRGLPFELTADQARAVAEIRADMEAPRPMNRMLLGDVGCGKTVVAAFALALAADSGCQAAMMAPTEILARQHAEKLGPLLQQAGVSSALLTGSATAAQRRALLEDLAAGRVQVLFGTHALIEDDVRFARLSLAVIDEQHRFGVGQRAALRRKGEGCDLLVMTATPIPRTLALTLYGDLDTSCIRQRPGNRPPVATRLISRDNRRAAYEAIRRELAKGNQAYIVCPLVGLSSKQRRQAAEDGSMGGALRGEGELANLKAAREEAAYLGAKVFPNANVGLLTGDMPPAQKAQVMEDFARGQIQVLVATTVVEVGIDVPGATVMMIEDADRFGLSQLHQLRGRVGRGQQPAQVFLVADPGDDDALRARMEAVVSTTDGFALAQADLAARREGDVLGSRQHGDAHLKLVNVADDAELVSMAHGDARAILAADQGLEAAAHAALAAELKAVFSSQDSECSKGA